MEECYFKSNIRCKGVNMPALESKGWNFLGDFKPKLLTLFELWCHKRNLVQMTQRGNIVVEVSNVEVSKTFY